MIQGPRALLVIITIIIFFILLSVIGGVTARLAVVCYSAISCLITFAFRTALHIVLHDNSAINKDIFNSIYVQLKN